MTSKHDVVTWFNRTIPEYRERLLYSFSGHDRKRISKAYQVMTDKFIHVVNDSYGYPFKFMLRLKFDLLWSECIFIAADPNLTDKEIRINNTVMNVGTDLLREFDRAFKIGRCK